MAEPKERMNALLRPFAIVLFCIVALLVLPLVLLIAALCWIGLWLTGQKMVRRNCRRQL
jgi:hypothetical protein